MHVAIRRDFQALAIRRSPENLSCDGECSRREIQRRHKAIMEQWKELEVLLGRKVALEEIERDWV